MRLVIGVIEVDDATVARLRAGETVSIDVYLGDQTTVPVAEAPAPVPADRVAWSSGGRIVIPDDAAECSGPLCAARGAVGYYYPASGETECGICVGRGRQG